MKKTLLTLTALAAATGTAYAQSNVTIYGLADTGIEYANHADAAQNSVCASRPAVRTRPASASKAAKTSAAD